jgi:hypothetical protein
MEQLRTAGKTPGGHFIIISRFSASKGSGRATYCVKSSILHINLTHWEKRLQVGNAKPLRNLVELARIELATS